MRWKETPLSARVTAAHVDIMRHPEFALLSGAVMMGRVITVSNPGFTAGTNGRDVVYGEEFCAPLCREELRGLVAHEAMHKMLGHTYLYKDLHKKYPAAVNKAMDFVINLAIMDMDTAAGGGFVRLPAGGCFDEKYRGMSFIDVLRDLLKGQTKTDSGGKGGGEGKAGAGETLDDHSQFGSIPAEEVEELARDISAAIESGKLVKTSLARLRGTSGSGGSLDAVMRQRNTNWREPLARFLETRCRGDDLSRIMPPSRRMLAAGFLMPSHFSESAGEIVVACDTSGSMDGVLPVVLGEIARLCDTVHPSKVRLLWWDTTVCGEQVVVPGGYGTLGTLMQPAGGGGTTMSCVAEYMATKKIAPQVCVFLTDGGVENNARLPDCPVLVCVVDNDQYMPPRGQVLRIYSDAL